MNKQTVGMENLPNIYIDGINVVSNTLQSIGKQFNIKVTLMMVDKSLEKSWFGRIDDLKIKCSFIQDDKIEGLNSGDLSLFDIPAGLFNSTIVESCNEFELVNTKQGYDYYKKIIEINLINPNKLNVYVATFIDDLGFGIPMFDKFYGPMSAERVLVNGEINTESGYFYYPDTNEEYGGPVHTQNQGYMEGSEHSSDPHSELVYVSEENYKITSNQVDVFVGVDLTRTPEENRQELRPGYVDPNPDERPIDPIRTQSVSIEDPNVPSDPLMEIYE